MDFVHLLMHSLVDIPANTTSMPITYYLPKNTTMDGTIFSVIRKKRILNVVLEEW